MTAFPQWRQIHLLTGPQRMWRVGSACLQGEQWEAAELSLSQLHSLVPMLFQLKELWELNVLRLVCWWDEVAHERDMQAAKAVLPSLD